jgi:hypothetical protein
MDEPGGEQRSGPSGSWGADWFADYMARSTDFWQRTARASASLAATWGDRSLQEGEWTIDSVTADVIEAWEELTPLTGEGLELWLELVQRSLRVGRTDV